MSVLVRPLDAPMYVAGVWTAGETGERMDATSPATGETLGTVPAGTRADVRRAVAAANEASPGWAGLSPFDRARLLYRIAENVDARRDELARLITLDQGKP